MTFTNGVTYTTTITDYPDYKNISRSNIQVGIRHCGGHGSDAAGGDLWSIDAYCSGYDPETGKVSILVKGNIRAGYVILCIV